MCSVCVVQCSSSDSSENVNIKVRGLGRAVLGCWPVGPLTVHLYRTHCVTSIPSLSSCQDPRLQLDLEPWGVNTLFMIVSRAERFRYPGGIMTSNSIDILLFTYVNIQRYHQCWLKVEVDLSGHFYVCCSLTFETEYFFFNLWLKYFLEMRIHTLIAV